MNLSFVYAGTGLLKLKRKGVVKMNFLKKRVFPGFTIGEGGLWLCFHISWAVLLGGLYYFSGRFNDPAFFSLSAFSVIQAYVLLAKALVLLPFWWLYFIRLKEVKLAKKVWLHGITGFVYAFVTVGLVYGVKIGVLQDTYPKNAV